MSIYLKKEFDDEINQIWLIYTNSFEYYNCLKQLRNYKRTEFSDSRFLSFMTYTSWYILIIELCKVFQHDNKNQHFNIYGLLNRLINNYKNIEFRSLISLSEIQKYNADFTSAKILEIRKRLVELRDKFYAHIDREEKNFEEKISLTYSEIEFLLDTLHHFISEMKLKVLNSHVEFKDDIFVDLTSLLKNTEDFNRKYHEKMMRKYNDESNKLKSEKRPPLVG